MIGKASVIKTMRVGEGSKPFDTDLNAALEALGNKEIISIQTHTFYDTERNYNWMDALIIYKEGKEPCCFDPFCIGQCKEGETA